MTDDDAGLHELAAAIARGSPIDWASTESTSDNESRAVIRELKVIAEIADFHCSEPLPGQPLPIASWVEPLPETVGTWGTFRLVEKVGEGAYGEVYRAWDTRLDREVAVKLLPASFADGEARATSIIEEGRLLARVRHPNVVTIYGAERVEHRIGLWMEFVKGRTLEQVLQHTKVFDSAKAIDIGVELCQAISAVHRAGLLHRDIKAHNVMLDDDGRVVLMDFGTGRELNDPSTTGIAGTPLYLAPELLAGGAATVRSDIYSVGVLLYHLLTGAYPVQARGLGDLRLAHERHERTGVRSARPDLPPKLTRVIERAIDPQPERRHASVDALAADLVALKPRSSVVRLAYATGVAAVLILAVIVGWEVLGRLVGASRTPSALLAEFAGVNPAGAANAARKTPASQAAKQIVPLTSLPGDEAHPALSSDGTQIAFGWNRGGDWHVYVKQIGADATRQLTSLGGGVSPAWSPDGQSIAFVRRFLDDGGTPKNAVLVIPVLGGAERTIWLGTGHTILGLGLDWSPRGTHLVTCAKSSPDHPHRLLLVSVVSGESHWVTSPPSGTMGDSYPVFAPDGESIAFVRKTGSESGIYLQDLAGGDPKRLMTASSDIRRLAWSPNGDSLIFTSYRGAGRNTLSRVSLLGGEPEAIVGTGEGAGDPSTSRGGSRLAFAQNLLDQNLYRAELVGERIGSVTPLIPSARKEADPDISPDGSRIAFVSDRLGHNEIWVMQADGSDPKQLTELQRCRRPRWSPDGRQIAFTAGTSLMGSHIYVVDGAGGAPRRLTSDPSNDQWPTWSQDGRWIYFWTERNGVREIWKVPAAGGPVVQVTTEAGGKAWESSDGRFLYYSTGAAAPAILRMPVGGGPPTLIFKLPNNTTWGGEWIAAGSGIYWLNINASPRPSIEFFRFATGRVTRVMTPAGLYDDGSGFAVSPDGSWLVFTQRDYVSSDIMMMEGIP